uniref:Uncharacterized protein n=1 Tax=Cacopsylla melanoneura TaxID=428564 RepID=A0A8D9ER70_9HEMI
MAANCCMIPTRRCLCWIKWSKRRSECTLLSRSSTENQPDHTRFPGQTSLWKREPKSSSPSTEYTMTRRSTRDQTFLIRNGLLPRTWTVSRTMRTCRSGKDREIALVNGLDRYN